jgi:hypothetical protein
VQRADQHYPSRVRNALLISLLVIGCRSTVELERAVIVPADVEKAIAAEQSLAPSYDVLPSSGERWFEVREGKGSILIVAGHATAQTREGALKVPDRGTGGLAIALHELTGATVIYTTRRSPSDPNYYDDNEFKAELARIVKQQKPALVLDLHASHSYRPYDVDFGVMGGRSLLGRKGVLESLVAAFRREGLSNFSRDYFPAAKNQTVTKFVSAMGVPAVQLEISSAWLDPARDPYSAHRFAQLLQALVKFIRERDE